MSSSRSRLLLLAALALGCAPRANASAPAPSLDEVTLTPLTEGVWVHTTWARLASGLFSSSGLLVCSHGVGLLVDTAWNDAQTERLLALADARECPVRALVVTHFHNDRMGGIGAVLRRGVATYAYRETVTRAQLPSWSPTVLDSPGEVRVGNVTAEVFFPGEAHTPDNVVVWLRDARTLFGGCMVRARSWSSLGNVADANLAAWPASARALVERYGSQAAHVVPGHGEPGDASLLSHTLTLAEAARHP